VPQWGQVGEIRALTHPFSKLTQIFQGESYVNSSYYIYLIEWLKFQVGGTSEIVRWIDVLGNKKSVKTEDMTSFGRTVQCRLKQWLHTKLNQQNDGARSYSKEDLISALLDPRMKTFAFAGMEPYFPEAVKLLREEMMKYVTAESTVDNMTSQIGAPIAESTSRVNVEVDDEFSFMASRPPAEAISPATPILDTAGKISFTCESELKRWLSLDACQRSSVIRENYGNPMSMVKLFNPLDFWHEVRSEFPFLHIIAMRYLPSPCAESFAERMFSSGGTVAGNCDVKTVERRIQMRINSRLLDKSIGIVRKVPIKGGGFEYLLNLDYIKECIPEEEDFGEKELSEDDQDD